MIHEFFLKHLPDGLSNRSLESCPRWRVYAHVFGQEDYTPADSTIEEDQPGLVLLQEWCMRHWQLAQILKPYALCPDDDISGEAVAGFYFAMLNSLEGLQDILEYCKVTGIQPAGKITAKETDTANPIQ